MGIIRAAMSAVGGTLADQWLETIEADSMGDTTVMTSGISMRRGDSRNQNRRGATNVITDGSVIHVAEKQFMMLVEGGKIVDYSAEPGYYKVDTGSSPSLFNGQLEDSVRTSFERLKFGGVAPQSQRVFYINTQEIKNIAFGTVNPINYFDEFYNAELYLRAHGYFSIRIVDPLKFYAEAIPKNADRVDIKDIHKLYLSEFLTALQTAISQMSIDGIRISHVTAKSRELAQYMSTVLDEDWKQRRGMIIESVGINSISYDEDSKKLINLRNQGAMLSDASVREGFVQGKIASGIEAAGSNKSGSMAGFMGVGMGMQSGGNFMASASASNQAGMQQSGQGTGWKCVCGVSNTGRFCSECGKPQPSAASAWTCGCGQQNTGNFCSSCGKKRAANGCPKCGKPVASGAKFCGSCGEKIG